MALKLADYREIVGKNAIDELKLLADRLRGKVIQHINSTARGGGVAEILQRAVPLLQELGLDVRWDVIKGEERFFQVTKKFHNALQGRKEEISEEMFRIYLETNERNSGSIDFCGDIVFVHDPQPAALVKKRKEVSASKWIWRCHIDVSDPDLRVWDFLRQFVEEYDTSVFSAPLFARELGIPQFLISPSIDPLSAKNRELSSSAIESVLKKYGITSDKPVITQVSRFDYFKDPVGVIEAFRLVRKHIDCQLILAGNQAAADDPEAQMVLEQVREKAADDPDIHILLIQPETNDIDVNALQRASAVILQKSTREGFALTVTEALWKAKPVVASKAGGIPLQIVHGFNGLLSRTIEGTAYQVKLLLNNPDYGRRLGDNARTYIKRNFLLTRHLRDYLLLFLSLEYPKEVTYL